MTGVDERSGTHSMEKTLGTFEHLLAHLLALAGRIGIAVLFLPSGLGKLMSLGPTAGFIASKGLPAAPLLAGLSGALEVAAALALLLGWRTRWAALALAAFTLVAAVVFHDFWAAEGPQALFQRLSFFKNVGIAGGLLLLAASGPGRFALERSLSQPNT